MSPLPLTGSPPPFQVVPQAAVTMMLKHSVVVAALVLGYQVVAVEVTLVTVFADDEAAVAAEAVVGAAVAVVAAQPVNNHIITSCHSECH